MFCKVVVEDKLQQTCVTDDTEESVAVLDWGTIEWLLNEKAGSQKQMQISCLKTTS